MATTNPFADVGPWNTLGIGGTQVRATLVEIDGVKTTDEWKAQKSKETNGQVWVFSGTTVDKPKLTLEAVDLADFDDLRRVWQQLKPVPGQGAAVATAGAGSTSGIGSPTATAAGQAAFASAGAAAQASGASKEEIFAAANAAAQEASGGTSTGTFGAAGASSTPSTPNPGPRPPTVSVQNEILAWHGIYAIARGEWDGPKPTATNSWRVILTVVPQEPPTPAGAGAMAPATAGSSTASAASPGAAYSSGSGSMASNAAAGAAGT